MIRACPSPSPPCRGRGGSLRNSCLPLTLTSLQAVVAAGTHIEYRDLLEQAKHDIKYRHISPDHVEVLKLNGKEILQVAHLPACGVTCACMACSYCGGGGQACIRLLCGVVCMHVAAVVA